MDQDQQRDYAEEKYNRHFCPECGTSPCTADGGHPDSEPDAVLVFECCGQWLPYPQDGETVTCPGCRTAFVSGLPAGWTEWLSPGGVTHAVPPAGPCATCGRGRHDTEQETGS